MNSWFVVGHDPQAFWTEDTPMGDGACTRCGQFGPIELRSGVDGAWESELCGACADKAFGAYIEGEIQAERAGSDK